MEYGGLDDNDDDAIWSSLYGSEFNEDDDKEEDVIIPAEMEEKDNVEGKKNDQDEKQKKKPVASKKGKKREENVNQIPEPRSSHCSTDLLSKPVPVLRLSLLKSYPQGQQRRRIQGCSRGQCHGVRTHLTFGTSRFSAKNDKRAQLAMAQVIIKIFPPVDVGGVGLKFHCHGGIFFCKTLTPQFFLV